MHHGGLIGLESALQTPEEVLVMQHLLERGWSRRRIAAEPGISRNTLDRYLALGDPPLHPLQPTRSSSLSCRKLDARDRCRQIGLQGAESST